MIKHLPEGLVPFMDCGFARNPFQPLIGEPIRIDCRVDGGAEMPLLHLTMNGGVCTLSPEKWQPPFASFALAAYDRPCSGSYTITAGDQTAGPYSLDILWQETVEKALDCRLFDGAVYLSLQTDVTLRLLGGAQPALQLLQEPCPAGESLLAYTLNCDGSWCFEVAKPDSIWQLKRFGKVIAELASITLDRTAKGTVVKVSQTHRISATVILGMGERFDSVNQWRKGSNGRVVEKYTHQGDQTYLPIPFFMTEQGYGWYRTGSIPCQMRFGDVTTLTQQTEGSLLAEDVLFFGQPKELLRQLISRTGTPALPPRWSFGLWMSANGWDCDSEVNAQLEAMKAYDYPASVMVLEAWSDERTFYLWNDQKHWANPAETVKRIRDAGLHLVLWQIPIIKYEWDGEAGDALTADSGEAVAKGYCVKSADGSPYRITEQWFHHSLLIDFTNPAARQWWFDKRAYLLDMGVEGFKTDGGEFLFEQQARLYDGSSGLTAHNLYPVQYAMSYHDFMSRRGVKGVTFSRAGFAGAQRCPMHWAGDQTSQWSELSAQLTAGLSAGLSGVLFWGFDIGGFAGDLPDAELYLRATAMGCFAPVMQWHAEPRSGQFYSTYPAGFQNDRSPWNLAEKLKDESILTISCQYAKLREKLLPYLWQEAQHCVSACRPMLAHLCIDFPDDPAVWTVSDQYMLGRRLLVAPITQAGAKARQVYLPKGSWRHYFTKETIRGGAALMVTCPLEEIPVWERVD